MVKVIDMRSDVVTRPTPGMRQAMATAEVGDDVSREDPTVNRLEELCAKLTGKEASIFVCSGTMANLLCVKAWTHHGDEFIAEESSHMTSFETGGSAAFAGVQWRAVRGDRGSFDADDIAPLIRGEDIQLARTRLICMENTHTMAGGAVFPLEKMRSVAKLARERDIRVHVDGARIWNAVIATGIGIEEYAACCDSLSFCLSKGLGCPAGSIVSGPADFVARVRKYRKMVGGGMRQTGILAAAGLYALEHHIQRLREDHDNAKRLARALAELPKVKIDLSSVETNLVVFEIAGDSEEWMARFREKGVLLCPYPRNRIRAVTHIDVSSDDVDRVIEIARDLIR